MLQVRPRRHGGLGVAGVLLVAACSSAPEGAGPRSVRPVEPAGPAASGAAAERAGHVRADADFMRAMIVHHAQALEMSALVADRSAREEIRLLARRIAVSQADEIGRMERWLLARGEAVPDAGQAPAPAHRHGAGPGDHGPGMLTAEEMTRLRATRGTTFDRLFVELMIRHHEGALVMVEELFASPGAGRDPELFLYASHVDADQRMEIARMRRLLDTVLQ